MPLVAVYGTLRDGMGNNALMGDSEKLGEIDVAGFEMYPAAPYGGFPVIFPVSPSEKTSHVIKAEIYQVSEERLTGPLDRLEGHPTWYKRELIPTPYGEAWIYVMQDERYKENTKIESGDFVEFYYNLRGGL